MGIERIAVLGAGVMGSGIAAQAANAGLSVLLLDVASDDSAGPDDLARAAVARLQQQHPVPLMMRDAVKRIEAGSMEHDLNRIKDVDWVIEAVVEQVTIKRALYRRIDAIRSDATIVSSNTSTIPLATLTEGLSDGWRSHFLITHFFNPPRYMRLLELVAAPSIAPEALAAVIDCVDRRFGKGIVHCKDTPGFIGNRIGVFWMQCALLTAIKMGLRVEEADAIMGAPLGIPRSGVFGLLDLIGIDLMPFVVDSMRKALPADDALHRYSELPPLLGRMIANGYSGRKGKGGFYRLQMVDGKRVKQAIDLPSGEYRALEKPQWASLATAPDGGMEALVRGDDRGGRYATEVLTETLHYAASIGATIADDIDAIDRAMRLGYNWKYGPFELIDELGIHWLSARCEERHLAIPPHLTLAHAGYYRVHNKRRQFLAASGQYHDLYSPPDIVCLADMKHRAPPVASSSGASLWDIGSGVAVLEIHRKMNTMDAEVLDFILQSLDCVGSQQRALVIYNDSEQFSAGADLKNLLAAIDAAHWEQLESTIANGQTVFKALRYAPFPVVGAPAGVALGGGCELLLHCDAIQAHAETYCGLVELGAGIIPAWGGCMSLLARYSEHFGIHAGPMPAITKAFTTIATAALSTSAAHARELGFLSRHDGITMNRDRLLGDAKTRAIALCKDYRVPSQRSWLLPGRAGQSALDMVIQTQLKLGKATAYDGVIATALSTVLSGGDADGASAVSEEQLYALEQTVVMPLIQHPKTRERIAYLLVNGKPLRN